MNFILLMYKIQLLEIAMLLGLTNLLLGLFTMLFFDTYGWLMPVFTQGLLFGLNLYLQGKQTNI